MNRYLRLPDGTTWPEPWPIGQMDASVEWLLRYGSDLAQVRYTAASVCAAYAALIEMPRRRRERVIADIRRALEDRKTIRKADAS